MLNILINIGIFIVAALHAGFCILEMYFWQKPLGRKIFRTEESFAQQSAVLAANQGLYNAFLSAGLFWSLFSSSGTQFKFFFLLCVIIAGVYGAITASKNIFFVQALPAIITFILLLFSI